MGSVLTFYSSEVHVRDRDDISCTTTSPASAFPSSVSNIAKGINGASPLAFSGRISID
jgi:hypothetical protein